MDNQLIVCSTLIDKSFGIYHGYTLEQLKIIRENTKSYNFIIVSFANYKGDFHDMGCFGLSDRRNIICVFCKSRYNIYPYIEDNPFSNKFTKKELNNIKRNTKEYVICHCYNSNEVLRSKFFI